MIAFLMAGVWEPAIQSYRWQEELLADRFSGAAGRQPQDRQGDRARNDPTVLAHADEVIE